MRLAKFSERFAAIVVKIETHENSVLTTAIGKNWGAGTCLYPSWKTKMREYVKNCKRWTTDQWEQCTPRIFSPRVQLLHEKCSWNHRNGIGGLGIIYQLRLLEASSQYSPVNHEYGFLCRFDREIIHKNGRSFHEFSHHSFICTSIFVNGIKWALNHVLTEEEGLERVRIGKPDASDSTDQSGKWQISWIFSPNL